jgi:hypothetical protein
MKNLALHILDIAENSVRAEARTIFISINESVSDNTYNLSIEDDGNGMPAELLMNVTDAFTTTRTTRKVGLGLPLLKQHAEMCNGSLAIQSEPGKGCKVHAAFTHNHIDKPPTGDIPGVIRILTSGNRNIRIVYSHTTDSGRFEFDSDQVKSELGETEFYNPLIQKYIKEMIYENLTEIKVS